MTSHAALKELVLPAIALPVVRRMAEGPLATAVALAARDATQWPRRHGNATGLGVESIVYAHKRYAVKACAELADLDPEDYEVRLPLTLTENAELAGLDPDANDQQAVVFHESALMIPLALFGLLVEDGEIEPPRSFAVAFRAKKCDPRKTRPGISRSTASAGAVFVEAALVAEGRRIKEPGTTAEQFDRYAVQIVSVPVEQLGGETEDEMIVRVVATLLDHLDRVAGLLEDAKHPTAAKCLRDTPFTADVVRYGAPKRRGALHATSEERWLGTSYPVWDLLRQRHRLAALAIAPTLEPTEWTESLEAVPGLSDLVFGRRGSGYDLVRLLERVAGARDSDDLEYLLRRLEAEPFTAEELASANIDTDDADWYRIEQEVLLRSVSRARPTSHQIAFRRGALGAVNAYMLNGPPSLAMLEAADSSYLHGVDPYAVCQSRQWRRFGSPIDLTGRCTEGTWTGLTASMLSANAILVAAARQQPLAATPV